MTSDTILTRGFGGGRKERESSKVVEEKCMGKKGMTMR